MNELEFCREIDWKKMCIDVVDTIQHKSDRDR